MVITFDQLWEKSESFHQDASIGLKIPNIIEELLLKLNLYKAIDAQIDIPEEDRQKAKSHTMGEILLTLTNLSLKDNINVYEALNMSLHYRSAAYFNKKHPM